MTKCPNCFTGIPVATSAFVCVNQNCAKTVDTFASRYSATEVIGGYWYQFERPAEAKGNWAPPTEVRCSACNEMTREACPTCHTVLLPDWRASNATCIAMNGARATGKSVYVATVVRELEELSMRLSTTFAYGDQQTREIMEEIYQKPLFVEGGLMAPTPASNTNNSYQRFPLIFSLGRLKGVRQYLVIRDIAGEEMEQPPAVHGHLDFLGKADAIIFMFDPLAVPKVREKLTDLVPAQLQAGGDPALVLQNLLQLTRSSCPPVAVVLSKFDAVQELRRVEDVEWSSIMSNTGAAMMRDPSEQGTSYDETDGALLDQEIKSLLHRLGGAGVVFGLESPHDGQTIPHRYFAVSALGESPEGRRLHARGITSFRCLDPVKWILSKKNVLATTA
ncbi:hypothetical protein [Pseudoclavibacter helvolus]|uniref:hypothetical protein n=1 Tax=Pseudoclavibacter helvolus TaxID=255205 RepID=UPI00373528B8